MTVPLTLLTITPISGGGGPALTPYSARGLTQTLEQFVSSPFGSVIRRDINGGLLDMTHDQFRKYKSTITCTDSQAPAFDGAQQGQLVEVECAVELSYLTAGGSPNRSVVTGSSRTEGDYTYYRPKLTMMVINFQKSFAEWESRYQWSLELQEV